MKTAVCLIALCYVAMAQTLPFNGVTIGGTPDSPTISNPAGNPAVIGYGVVKYTTTNVNTSHLHLPFDAIAWGAVLAPGTTLHLSPFVTGVMIDPVDKDTGVFKDSGDPTRYELFAVLFQDGSYSGNPDGAKFFQQKIDTIRNFAKSMQGRADRFEALAKAQAAYGEAVHALTNAAPISVDMSVLNDTSLLANDVMDIRAKAGDAEADKALTRIVALPDLKEVHQ